MDIASNLSVALRLNLREGKINPDSENSAIKKRFKPSGPTPTTRSTSKTLWGF
jgi:hypothetical protein